MVGVWDSPSVRLVIRWWVRKAGSGVDHGPDHGPNCGGRYPRFVVVFVVVFYTQTQPKLSVQKKSFLRPLKQAQRLKVACRFTGF